MREVDSRSVDGFICEVMREVYEKRDIKIEICCSENAIEPDNSNYYLDNTSSIAYLYDLYSLLDDLNNSHCNPVVLYDVFNPFTQSDAHKLFLLF